jgi:integrating conjugative element protein (TIGR03749 family)
MRHLLSVILLFCLSITAHADSLSSLTLTDSEMQKLKKYFPTEESNHLMWKGDPIEISLPISKEKRIIFSKPISVDVKSALKSDQLRILNNDKSLYLTALKSFPTTRIYVTLKESGEVMLIDLISSDSASNTTQQIDIQQNSHTVDTRPATANDSANPINENNDTNTNDDISSVDLIRLAWQEVYSPERLIQKSMNLTRSPMHTEKFISDLVYGDKVIAYPESSWILGNHYVTAILLRNKYQHVTTIDTQKDLCGDWQASSLYPTAHLEPNGEKQGDSAMLFLVSNRPFSEAMGVCHGNA